MEPVAPTTIGAAGEAGRWRMRRPVSSALHAGRARGGRRRRPSGTLAERIAARRPSPTPDGQLWGSPRWGKLAGGSCGAYHWLSTADQPELGLVEGSHACRPRKAHNFIGLHGARTSIPYHATWTTERPPKPSPLRRRSLSVPLRVPSTAGGDHRCGHRRVSAGMPCARGTGRLTMESRFWRAHGSCLRCTANEEPINDVGLCASFPLCFMIRLERSRRPPAGTSMAVPADGNCGGTCGLRLWRRPRKCRRLVGSAVDGRDRCSRLHRWTISCLLFFLYVSYGSSLWQTRWRSVGRSLLVAANIRERQPAAAPSSRAGPPARLAARRARGPTGPAGHLVHAAAALSSSSPPPHSSISNRSRSRPRESL